VNGKSSSSKADREITDQHFQYPQRSYRRRTQDIVRVQFASIARLSSNGANCEYTVGANHITRWPRRDVALTRIKLCSLRHQKATVSVHVVVKPYASRSLLPAKHSCQRYGVTRVDPLRRYNGILMS
jgi:hypothetical protein